MEGMFVLWTHCYSEAFNTVHTLLLFYFLDYQRVPTLKLQTTHIRESLLRGCSSFLCKADAFCISGELAHHWTEIRSDKNLSLDQMF